MSIADAMASNGMKEAGYEYINFDGKRVGRRRDQGGEVILCTNLQIVGQTIEMLTVQ